MVNMKEDIVLITGATGLIGRNLTGLLLQNGYKVSIFSRKRIDIPGIKVFLWNPDKGEADEEAVKTSDYIVHLAGTNIAGKRWTAAQKEEIFRSRIGSGMLLLKMARETGSNIKAFITASGINYYGTLTSEKIFSESDPPASDFLGRICKVWEETADEFAKLGSRSVKIRTAIALSERGGILEKMAASASLGVTPVFGSGRQYMPWIHIDDLCRIYLKAVSDPVMQGAYNAVAPEHVTNREFMKTLAEARNKPLIAPPVPAAILKLAFGEMAGLLLEGSRMSSEKIRQTGFEFRYPLLKEAFNDLI
ncbi:MAG TPA: TIGR01777 family oxidoreductase [Bacteroidales bacterium]|nr:TIGR01777 family oxidoreductase [Bacteroidales bacterium]